MAEFTRTVLVKADAKMIFQFLTEVEMLEDILPSVREVELHTPPPFGVGTEWTELPRRWLGLIPRPGGQTFKVTAYDKTKRRLVAESGGVTFTFEAKKGGTRSCNLHMKLQCDDDRRLIRAERLHADRLDHVQVFVDG